MAKVKGRPNTVQTTLRGVKITKQKTRPQEPKTIIKQNQQSIKRNSQNPIIKPTIAPATHLRIKNCIVKVARLRPKKTVDQIVSESSRLVPAATVPNSKVQATSKLTDETRPVTNNEIRKCVVKLKRIKQTDSAKLSATAIKSTKTTKSKGRQPRMATITEENLNTPAMEVKENSCTAKMNSPSTKPQTEAVIEIANQTKEKSFLQEEQSQIPMVNSPKRKKLKNLSLTRRKKKSLNKTQNDMHDITSFDPLRNSTVINFDLNTINENNYTRLPTELTNKIHDDSNKILENEQSDVLVSDKKQIIIPEEFDMSQKSNGSFKSENLANQISKIEELLALDTDDDIAIDDDVRLEKQSHDQDTHNDNSIMSDNDSKTEEPLSTTMDVKAQVHKFFHTKDAVEFDCNANAKIPCQSNSKDLRQSKSRSQRRKSAEKVKSVYEFSPSQSSDTDTNTNKDPAADIIRKMIEEGKVTVTTRRKGAGRPIVKRIVNKYTKPKAAANQRGRNATNKRGKKALQPAIVDDYVQELPSVMENRKAPAPQDQALNGTFSRLARSVMLNESGKYDSHRRIMLNKRQLLEVALKFVSTPLKNSKTPTPAINHTLLSPISAGEMPVHKLKGNASPWRVPDTTSIPQTFHFSRNSSNLPSFSSEYIPSSPKKNVKWANNLIDSMPSSHNQSHAVASTSATAAQLTSSYSSNDSNGENVPPPIYDEVDNENVNLDSNDLQPITTTTLNRRRASAKRSPLKAINILEVVTLPPWKPMNENCEDASKVKEPSKTPTEDAFGFDELLSSSELSSGDEHREKSSAKPKRSDLRKRLKQLKKWRPPDRELPQSKNTRMPKVFDDDAGKLRMHNIKDMFCSTMIKAQQAVKPIDSDESDDDEENAPANSEAQPDLFNDTDPQISFNDKKPHRTYGRPVRKKRKQPNNFVLFQDSDESDGGDDNADNEKKHGEHQKKRNPKQADKNNMELKSFVENFNEMCEEVDNYELIVE